MGFLECLHFLRQSVLRFSQLELQLRILRYDTNQLLLPFKHSLFRGKVTRLNRLIVRLHLVHQCRVVKTLCRTPTARAACSENLFQAQNPQESEPPRNRASAPLKSNCALEQSSRKRSSGKQEKVFTLEEF